MVFYINGLRSGNPLESLPVEQYLSHSGLKCNEVSIFRHWRHQENLKSRVHFNSKINTDMKLLIHIVLQGILIYLIAHLLTGVHVAGYTDALLAAILLSIANTFVKPVLTILTLPVTILTLGLFLFVINGLMVLLVDALLQGFEVVNLFWAVLFSIIFSIFNYLFLQYSK